MTSTDQPALQIERPPRSLSSFPLGLRLFTLDLRRQLLARKTLTILIIQLLPILIGAFFVIGQNVDGMTLFRNTVEHVYIPFLLPLAALFFGGPTIVNEVEGRTITYLTLRPISRSALYLAKLASSIGAALAVTLLPVLLLFGVSLIGSADGFSESLALLGPALGAIAIGAVAYTSLFAFLGALASATLLLGIVYFVIIEMVLAVLPVLELLSVKFHLRTIGGYQGADRASFLDRLILDQPLTFDWWVGLLIAALFSLAAIIAGMLVFREKQYHV